MMFLNKGNKMDCFFIREPFLINLALNLNNQVIITECFEQNFIETTTKLFVGIFSIKFG